MSSDEKIPRVLGKDGLRVSAGFLDTMTLGQRTGDADAIHVRHGNPAP